MLISSIVVFIKENDIKDLDGTQILFVLTKNNDFTKMIPQKKKFAHIQTILGKLFIMATSEIIIHIIK